MSTLVLALLAVLIVASIVLIVAIGALLGVIISELVQEEDHTGLPPEYSRRLMEKTWFKAGAL